MDISGVGEDAITRSCMRRNSEVQNSQFVQTDGISVYLLGSVGINYSPVV